MTKGQSRPEVMVATEWPGEPGPMDAWRRIPPPQPPKLHRQLKSSIPNMEHGEHVNRIGLDDVEPKEAEPWAQPQG